VTYQPSKRRKLEKPPSPPSSSFAPSPTGETQEERAALAPRHAATDRDTTETRAQTVATVTSDILKLRETTDNHSKSVSESAIKVDEAAKNAESCLASCKTAEAQVATLVVDSLKYVGGLQSAATTATDYEKKAKSACTEVGQSSASAKRSADATRTSRDTAATTATDISSKARTIDSIHRSVVDARNKITRHNAIHRTQ
jgi:hypothetical protein